MKSILTFLFILLISFPLLQRISGIVPRTTLVNVPREKEIRWIDMHDIKAGKFQFRFDQYLTHNSGLFGRIVKNTNQLNYDIFKTAGDLSSDTFVGKEGALFDRIYLNDLNGRYQTKHDEPEKQALQIKQIQDFLAYHSKAFLLVIHPNKAVFNPQWVPSSFRSPRPA